VKRTRWKAAASAIACALAAPAIAACGSGDDGETTTVQPPPVSAETANQLAKLSNRIATNLEAGETCSAAYAADDLKSAVEDSDLPANLRPGVDEVATDLVNQVNCPPPPPPPEPEKKPKKEKDEDENGDEKGHGNEKGPGDENGNGHDDGRKPVPPGQGGTVPPGQAKLKGEGDG
jgi:hypothetical protein